MATNMSPLPLNLLKSYHCEWQQEYGSITMDGQGYKCIWSRIILCALRWPWRNPSLWVFNTWLSLLVSCKIAHLWQFLWMLINFYSILAYFLNTTDCHTTPRAFGWLLIMFLHLSPIDIYRFHWLSQMLSYFHFFHLFPPVPTVSHISWVWALFLIIHFWEY